MVVEGGGPIGLLATFRLLMAGMNVKLVNGREEYIRPQVVFLDANWQAQLRYFFGTKFDQLFCQQNGFGRFWRGRALISLKYLEIAAKSRLFELMEFLKEKNAKKEIKSEGKIAEEGRDEYASSSTNLPLELIYGFNIEDVKHPKSAEDPNFYAVLKKSPQEKIWRQIPFDIFVCAGGANDRMRDKLFGRSQYNLRLKYALTSETFYL